MDTFIKSNDVQDAGERNPGTANQYSTGLPECNVSVIAPNASDVVVSGGVPALLLGIAGANGIVNGSVVVIKDGAIVIETFPASSIPVAGIPFFGSKFATNLSVNITVALGTSLKLYWRTQ